MAISLMEWSGMNKIKLKSESQWITDSGRVDAYMTVMIGNVLGADPNHFFEPRGITLLSEYAELAINAIREVDKQIVIEREYNHDSGIENILWRNRYLP
jgi:hypothetical protein